LNLSCSARRTIADTPHKERAAGDVATTLSKYDGLKDPDIAYLQGLVAAKLT
jgi:hypothetical protein